MEMTKKALLDICREHDLYRTAELNDKLYCNFKGFTAVTPALGAYCNIKALFLEGNALETLHGLPCLSQLRCLFLQQNLLTDLDGLPVLPVLDTLNVSHNRIESVTNLTATPLLTTFIAAGNLLKTRSDVEHVLQCKALLTLDLQNNKIDDIEVVDVLAELPQLRCLYLQGNEVVTKIRNYRRVVVGRLKRLTYLDDRPVFDSERRLTEAWMLGGLDAERMERDRIRDEERERERVNFEHLQQIRRDGWRKRRAALGLPAGDTDPFFDTVGSDTSTPADDADLDDYITEYQPISARDDGVIYLDSIKENEKALQARDASAPPGQHIAVVQRDDADQ